jgi:hypothetical protein
MKFRKVDTDVLFEGLNNGVTFIGRKGRKLIGAVVGTLEVEVDWGVAEYYTAVKLPTGEIVGALDNNTVFSLAGKSFFVHWGEYAPFIPDYLRTKLERPKTLNTTSHQEICDSDKDGLPF